MDPESTLFDAELDTPRLRPRAIPVESIAACQRLVVNPFLALLGWLAAAITLGAMGVYHVNTSDVPTIQYGILLPILIGALMIWRSETTKRIIAAVPQEWLVSVQFYRALGVIFLILYAGGILPGLFAFPAGIGDVAVGLLAPLVGLAYARAPRETASLVAAWNVLGILDRNAVCREEALHLRPHRLQELLEGRCGRCYVIVGHEAC